MSFGCSVWRPPLISGWTIVVESVGSWEVCVVVVVGEGGSRECCWRGCDGPMVDDGVRIKSGLWEF